MTMMEQMSIGRVAHTAVNRGEPVSIRNKTKGYKFTITPQGSWLAFYKKHTYSGTGIDGLINWLDSVLEKRTADQVA